ncbi:LasA protease [Saccharothrix carnea]|uniref:LasA protease n=1 Tax=Saccharothrix carnea TaxID=1280637 RepID=A0A2P8I2H2_SACCR|nr:peptidoglycan DD-metalloendopeptidase family protein [Saccharothrix carnea]PSL52661.1 LasA protease [Saccharothrix carnea]
MTVRTRAAATIAAVLSAAIAGTPATAAPVDLTSAVVAEVRHRATAMVTADRSTVVTPARQHGDWAFGTAVLTTPPGSPRLPDGWLFVAHRADGAWTVALEGEPGFAELTGRAPVVGEAERPLLAHQDGRPTTAAGGDLRTGMALPFAVGQTWAMAGGPHGWSGAAAPWSSLDLAGGDQRVLAARAGTAYTMCTGWVRVIHDRGYATDYYHLWNNINVNGAAVSQGTFLGHTGTDVTCGGAASGRHVHFGLRQNSAYVGIAEHNVGKWVPQNGASAYQGSALHGSTRVYAGGSVHNYGALGFTQGVIDANGGGTVNKRTGPGTGHALAGSVDDGATVSVSCSANGTTHTGRWGTTSLWNRLTDGTWVTDAFMWTGVTGPVNGYC